MTDEQMIELVLRAQSGDRDAFGELAAQFQPTIYATVLRRLRNQAEALEVTQDVFVQAMRKLDQLREPERFAGWLRRIAIRMSINRAVRRPHEMTGNATAFADHDEDAPSPLEDILRRERSVQVWGGLKRLRDLDRRTLIAFYIEGQSLKQMSAEFDSPIGTIKRRLHTARNRLRDELTSMQPA